MSDIFNAKSGRTLLIVPNFMALTVCKVLDALFGGLHDYEPRV